MVRHLNMPKDTLGFWMVTTEGYVEGRSTKNLGVHYGHIDEIALRLINNAYYSLSFDEVFPYDLVKNELIKEGCVNINFGIETGTWDLKGEERTSVFKKFFQNRPCYILDGNIYASVKITHSNPEDIFLTKKRAALKKLTVEERKLLGLKEE